ncbi:TetR family transcriptional regulator [Chelativorans sp. ZYF759]|uniref:TetR/AcrR family transcriptional regulator n=1 Tax=Chelativorans sp. ZYF759 TaxID=2692213 RepID=UPI00145C9BED|nr:TetR/AcrR family transcriptional regulator [Chelativorans sp. ZYF759]NMG39309.1 TetR family transcriptional regulator [Chelativorans sp. ZYF759]
MAPSEQTALKDHLLEIASSLFYAHGIRAVGVDLIVAEAGVAKTSLYRHFRTKDDLIAAFLGREDQQFWQTWQEVADRYADNAGAELDAHLEWIGARLARPNYRGCPQINAVAEFSDPKHPARKIAADHKAEMRRRLKTIAVRLGSDRPDELAGQLALLINGAFVSAGMLAPEEAIPLLQNAARLLLAGHAS